MARCCTYSIISKAVGFVFAVTVTVVSGCGRDDSRRTDEEAIEEIRTFFETAGEAVSRGDVEAEVNRFTPDGIYMWPDGPSIEGRDSLRAWFEHRFAQVDVEVESHTEEIRVFDDWAYERGTSVVYIRPKGSETVDTVRGKHLNILRRQADGSWRIARRIRNRDHPPMD